MDELNLTAKFLKSSSKLKECPPPNHPEYAFVGRSNVGKSSLINMLTRRKDLAKTSGKPGKTQLINHFSIVKAKSKKEVDWYLVDLPGYGYAKVSKTLKAEFQKLIFPFLEKRESLMCVFVLIDVRHSPQKIDLEFMEYLAVKEVPFVMVFTKADKLNPETLEANIQAYNSKMSEFWEELPKQFITSAAKAQGRNELLTFIDTTNGSFHREFYVSNRTI